MRVTIYTKTQCQPCRLTKMRMDQLGIQYQERPADPDYLRSLGYTAVPVVEAHYGDGVTTSWSGFRPELISELHKTL